MAVLKDYAPYFNKKQEMLEEAIRIKSVIERWMFFTTVILSLIMLLAG